MFLFNVERERKGEITEKLCKIVMKLLLKKMRSLKKQYFPWPNFSVYMI